MQRTKHAGVEIAFRDFGGADGSAKRSLLLIMGIQFNSAHWDAAFLDGLAQASRVVVFDNRGTGASTRDLGDFSARDWALDALAVLDAAGIERADVLGYSMGGRIAQELAVEWPDRVNSLVLLSSTIGGPKAAMPEAAGLAALMPRADVPPAVAVRESLEAIAGPEFSAKHPERLAALVAASLSQPTHLAVVQKQLAVLRDHRSAELAQLDLPCLVVHGDADPLVPLGNGRALHELIARSKMHTLEGVGHLTPCESCDQLLDLLRRFYTQLDS